MTGGSGLIGSHIIEQLTARGDRVRALVRSDTAARAVERFGAEPVRGDVCEEELIAAAACDVDAIVHAAAIVFRHASLRVFESVNVDGTRNVVRAAAKARARMVHVSSVAVYGRRNAFDTQRGGVDETFPFGPLRASDYYARTKRAAEQAAFSDAATLGVHVTALRPCVVYGERDRLFSRKLAAFLRRGVIPLIGSGANYPAVVTP